MSFHPTAKKFIRRFMDISDSEINSSTQKTLERREDFEEYLAHYLNDRDEKKIDAISLIADQFLYNFGHVNIIEIDDTIFLAGDDDDVIAFVRPEGLGTDYQMLMDVPHAGIEPPECVEGLLNESVIDDDPECPKNIYSVHYQGDLGVPQVSGDTWRNKKEFAVGSAVLYSPIVSNANRGAAEIGKVDKVFNTETYRGHRLYKDVDQPNAATQAALQANHDLTIAVAGACRAAAYKANPDILTICFEPHSYSMYSHEFLNAQYGVGDNKINVTSVNIDKMQRPLWSVLDVQTKDNNGYWTVTEQQMFAFNREFAEVLRGYKEDLPINVADHQPCEPDVYGISNGTLKRLDMVYDMAAYIAGCNYDSVRNAFKEVTVEFNRGLVMPLENSTDTTNKAAFIRRCSYVGEAMRKGLTGIVAQIYMDMGLDGRRYNNER